MSCVLGVIFHWCRTLKVGIEIPVISRHCQDMTEFVESNIKFE